LLLKTEIEKLTILPAGTPPRNPAELLSSKEMLKLINEVSTRYEDRYVIIDSPPPQLTAETKALASRVDGIVLVVGYGRTPRELITDMVENLGKEKIIGVVLNRFDLQGSKYYGYSKYGKYGKYGRYFEE
jgi:Mrp family chromosome partitioning ATPase